MREVTPESTSPIGRVRRKTKLPFRLGVKVNVFAGRRLPTRDHEVRGRSLPARPPPGAAKSKDCV